ncbi:MAG: GxxExxY protein [Vicinamibacterales bacterium]
MTRAFSSLPEIVPHRNSCSLVSKTTIMSLREPPFMPLVLSRSENPQEDGKAGSFQDGSEEIIGACIEVHRHLGPGLLESAYKACLCRELSLRGLPFEYERPLVLEYKGVLLECGYRIDLIVDRRIILEVKAVELLLPVHQAQVITYLKLTKLDTALLVNFNVPGIKSGLRRLTRKPT